MTDDEMRVYEKFHSRNWNQLSYAQRMEAVQELENLSANRNGAVPCPVRSEYLEGGQYGYYNGSEIVVNRHVLEKGEFVKTVTHKDGSTEQFRYACKDDNLQVMDTIFHEDYHSFQDQAVNGIVPQDQLDKMGVTPKLLHDWKANQSIANYISPDVDRDLYRIQLLEAFAYREGKNRTKEAFGYLNQKYGQDEKYQNYKEYLLRDSYINSYKECKQRYHNENIARDLQNKMNERYYGEHYTYANQKSALQLEQKMNESMKNAMAVNQPRNTQQVHSGTLRQNSSHGLLHAAPGMAHGNASTGTDQNGVGAERNDAGIRTDTMGNKGEDMEMKAVGMETAGDDMENYEMGMGM